MFSALFFPSAKLSYTVNTGEWVSHSIGYKLGKHQCLGVCLLIGLIFAHHKFTCSEYRFSPGMDYKRKQLVLLCIVGESKQSHVVYCGELCVSSGEFGDLTKCYSWFESGSQNMQREREREREGPLDLTVRPSRHSPPPHIVSQILPPLEKIVRNQIKMIKFEF